MRLLLNILWFVLCGLWMAIGYAIAARVRGSRGRKQCRMALRAGSRANGKSATTISFYCFIFRASVAAAAERYERCFPSAANVRWRSM